MARRFQHIITLAALVFLVPHFMWAQNSQVPFADPFVLLHDDVYYAYGTHSEDGIEVYTSSDLEKWKYAGLALHRRNTNQTRWFWAPEVYHIQGKFYMFYSSNERLYVAQSQLPQGPFVQHGGPLLHGLLGDAYCIDSTVFVDADGSVWMFFVRNDDGNCIWQVRLSEDYLTPEPSTLRKCFAVSAAWENIWPRVNEGPSILYRDGTYYLTYSANSYESQDYAIGYATSKSICGPWKKSERNPILHRIEGLYGTGHHTFFLDRNGALRIAFHAHCSATAIHPRAMYIGSMQFSSDGHLHLASHPILRPKMVKE